MQALLVVSPASDPLRQLASLSLVERNVLTLEHAGCEPIVLWCEDQDDSEGLRAHLAHKAVQIVSTPAALHDALKSDEETLVASASRVHDKGLGEVVATHASRPLAVTSDSGSALVLNSSPSEVELETVRKLGLTGLRARLGEIEVAGLPERFVDVEVVDDVSAMRARDALWLSCRKPMDGWVSTYLNRYLSLAMSRRLVNVRWLLPNYISVFCILLGFASLFLVLGGSYWSILAGALALKANSVIDGVDGELARVRWEFSATGELLDSLGDNISNFSFFGALVFVMFERNETFYASLGLAGLTMWLIHLVWVYARLFKKRRGNVFLAPSNVIQSAKGFWAKVIDVLGMKILRRDGFVMLALLFSAAAWYPGIMVMVLIGGGAVFLNVIGHYVFAKASH